MWCRTAPAAGRPARPPERPGGSAPFPLRHRSWAAPPGPALPPGFPRIQSGNPPPCRRKRCGPLRKAPAGPPARGRKSPGPCPPGRCSRRPPAIRRRRRARGSPGGPEPGERPRLPAVCRSRGAGGSRAPLSGSSRWCAGCPAGKKLQICVSWKETPPYCQY